MKLKKLLSAAIVCIVLFSSCASPYHIINPPSLQYGSKSSDKDVSLEYKYNLLHNRYEKKETRNGYKLIAVKLTNKSGKDMIVGQDIKFVYSNNNELQVEDYKDVYEQLKQGYIGYLLYLLFTPAKLTVTQNGVVTSSTPVGYALGPGLAGGNIAAASIANSKFKGELMNYSIMGTRIKNGDTVYGLIGVKSTAYETILVKVNDVVANKQ